MTREWFEARREQLRESVGSAATRTWVDPLTRKIFNSENTYLVRSFLPGFQIALVVIRWSAVIQSGLHRSDVCD